MKKDRDNAAETLGISYMEYIRQDCREKLDRESENGKIPDNLKDAVLEVLDEIGIKYRTKNKLNQILEKDTFIVSENARIHAIIVQHCKFNRLSRIWI